MYKFFNRILLLFLTYNIISLSLILLAPAKINEKIWKYTPYSYKEVFNYPLNLKNIPLTNKFNQDLLISFLDQSEGKNYLDIDYWNYKFNILNINQKFSDEIQRSFYKTFLLSKNNENKNLELKNYFLINYLNFEKKYQDKIIKNF